MIMIMFFGISNNSGTTKLHRDLQVRNHSTAGNTAIRNVRMQMFLKAVHTNDTMLKIKCSDESTKQVCWKS